MSISDSQRVVDITLSQIRPDPDQPRKDFSEVDRLARSMDRLGQLQPILISKTTDEMHKIVEGESRYLAAKQLGWAMVQCIIIEVEDEKRCDVQFAVNVMRSELNPFELADEYHRIMNQHELTQKQLAEQLDENSSTVSATLSLRRIPSEIRKRLAPISRRTGLEALALVARAEEPDAMERLAVLVESGTPVSKLRKASKEREGGPKEAKVKPPAKTTHSEVKTESVSELVEDETPDQVGTTDCKIAPQGKETFDEKVVDAWWRKYTIHAVRNKDLIEAFPAELKMNKHTLADWIDRHNGLSVGKYHVLTVSLAPGKIVHQLIPEALNRHEYQREAKMRYAEHKQKTISRK